MGKYAAIIAEVQSRLEKAAKPAGILQGWEYVPEPVSRVEGLDSLPCVAVQGMEFVEEYSASPNVEAVVQIGIIVATRRKDGIGAFAAGVERVMDAIETGANGFDGTLDGLVTEWPAFELSDAGIGDMSVSAIISVKAKPTRFNRGERRLA